MRLPPQWMPQTDARRFAISASSYSTTTKIWLRGLDSNQDNQLQRLACYQLHYPGMGKKSVADLATFCYSRKAYSEIDEYMRCPALNARSGSGLAIAA